MNENIIHEPGRSGEQGPRENGKAPAARVLSDAVLTDRAAKRLREFGMDVWALRKCLADCCGDRPRRPGAAAGPAAAGLAALDPGTLSVVRRVVDELMG